MMESHGQEGTLVIAQARSFPLLGDLKLVWKALKLVF
jgi:hypothetical protein